MIIRDKNTCFTKFVIGFAVAIGYVAVIITVIV